MKKIFLLSLFLFFVCTNVFSQDNNNVDKDALFNTDKSESTYSTYSSNGISILNEEVVDVGGRILGEFGYIILDRTFYDNTFYNPYTARLFVDGRYKNLVRGFIKARYVYDPTLETNKDEASLEELWIKFNISNYAFFTIGKQKIKWGSCMIFNPTDVMNSEMKNPFRPDDERLGVTLLKLHIPIDKANLYLIGSFDDVKNLDQIGYAARFELPISDAEFSIFARGQKGLKGIFGLDISVGIWNFDIDLEFAFSFGSNKIFYREDSLGLPESYTIDKDFMPKVSVGITYEQPYNNNSDRLVFAIEYFYNSEGYTDTNLYKYVFLNKAYKRFSLCKHYGILLISLPKPFSLDDFSFSIINLGNLTDMSFITWISCSINAISNITFRIDIAGHYGKDNSGEFTIGDQLIDLLFSCQIDF